MSKWSKLKFWKRKRSRKTVTKTETKTDSKSLVTTTNRNVNNPGIYYAKGLGGTEVISVTGWNPEQALDTFKKVREEVKKK